MIEKLINLERYKKNAIVIFSDILISILSMWLAFCLRLEVIFIPKGLEFLPFFFSILIFIIIFYIFRIYSTFYRYSGFDTLKLIFLSIILYSLIFGSVIIFIGVPGVPRSIGIIQPILFLTLVSLSRIFIVLLIREYLNSREIEKTLIYGAGIAGNQLNNILKLSSSYKIVAFIDDDLKKINKSFDGIKVYSPEKITELKEKYNISTVLLAIADLSKSSKREIIKIIAEHKLTLKILPDINRIISQNIGIEDFRKVEVEDLIEREKNINHTGISKQIAGRRILITGGGGSIGSELSMQITSYNPNKLIIIDNSEFNLYQIERKIKEITLKNNQNLDLITVLSSINDYENLREVFNKHKPEVVFHAAAYKHVPLLEGNKFEAIKNNILGAKNVIDLSILCECKNFVLISTDKAVKPNNIMGKTKRYSEIYLKSKTDSNELKTKLSIVRFGNVLDSSGSVVPLFREQINSGGPITITHPEVTRYFMTIPEAVSLILQAYIMSDGGEIYVLEMNKPIKIYDLAKNMINLSGLSLKDKNNKKGEIEIEFTGLRKGEKIFEELFYDMNKVKRTENKDIMIDSEKKIDSAKVNENFEALYTSVQQRDIDKVENIINSLILSYNQ